MYIEQVADGGNWRPSDRFPRCKPTSSLNPFDSQGNMPLSGAEEKKKKEREMAERARKEEKMKREEIAEGNEKNFTAQFLLLPDPIIRFCV